MFPSIFRTVQGVRHLSVTVYESCVSLAKSDAVYRVANGGAARALSTGSAALCEKKNDVASSNQDDKTNDPKESPTLVTQKAEDDGAVIKMAAQSEEPAVLQTDDLSATQQQVEEKSQQVVAAPAQVEPPAVKSGKEGLLDLLGTMKVEVTSKRKPKNLKAKQEYTPSSMSQPANMESTISMFQQATAEASSQSKPLDPELVSAASAAAATLPNSSQAVSELLRQLRQHEVVTDVQKKGDTNNLGVIIADMKVGRNPNRQKAWSQNPIRFDEGEQGYAREGGITAELDSVRRRRKLFSGKRLNIFSPSTEEAVEPAAARPTLWDIDFAHQVASSANNLPRNGLEEMLQWTKEGKLWQYPIDNEAGLEEEASVSFHEHVFLEQHLEEGFPRQGPVRHFMELVVTGLSKNPYLTVQQKKEHIFWFRDYFHQKADILQEADVYLS